MPWRAALCQMMTPGARGLAEAVAARRGKSPVVEVSPNGHVSARDPAASAPNSIVWVRGIIVCTIYLRV